MSKFIEYGKIVGQQNTTRATIHFRMDCKNPEEEIQIPEVFKYDKSEIIVDDYFQLQPICTINKGYWPKTRSSYTFSSGKMHKTKSFIYKGKVKKDANLSSTMFNVEVCKSNYELVTHILKDCNSSEGINQEFFTCTTVLRHVFKHESLDGTELHICVLKLRPGLYYHFGKLGIKGGNNEDELKKKLESLLHNLEPLEYFVPANIPVIQMLIDEGSPLLDSMKQDEVYCIRDSKYSGSISNIVRRLYTCDEELTITFECME